MRSNERPPMVSLELDAIDAIFRILVAPVDSIPQRLSASLKSVVSHSALTVVGLDGAASCSRHPGAGAAGVPLTQSEILAIGNRLGKGAIARFSESVGGQPRPVLATLCETGALLILSDPGGPEMDEFLRRLWQVLGPRLQRRAEEASPTYLRESRAAASIRAEAVAQLADQYTTTLESLLSILRSVTVDDKAARQSATNLATEAAIHVRTASDRLLTATEEPVTKAFERLRADLRPLVRYRNVEVQFVEPPVDGRALPGEVAHGARAVVRSVILALVDQPTVRRIRVHWDCDGQNLLIGVRDDGPGDLSSQSLDVRSVQQRVSALNGKLTVTATKGWGSDMSVVLPLDPPTLHGNESLFAGLSARELQVLERVAAGERSRLIAVQLGISENTVKFHLSKIYRRLGVHSRSELAAVMLNRVEPPTAPANRR